MKLFNWIFLAIWSTATLLHAEIQTPSGAFAAGNYEAEVEQVLLGKAFRDAFDLNVEPQHWIARNTGPSPESVKREAMLSRQASMACSHATRAWLYEFELIRKGHNPTPSKSRWTRQIYVEKCLTPIETVSDPEGGWIGTRPQNSKFLLRLLGTEGFARLRASIVYMPPYTGFCSGTLVWLPRNGEMVFGLMTAAHCLGDRIFQIEDGRLIADYTLYEYLELIDLDNRSMEFDVTDPERKRTYDVIGDDIAFVPLKTDVSRDEIGIMISASNPDPWQHVYLIGQNRLLLQHRRFLRSGNPGIPHHGTTVSMTVACRALGQFEELLLHNCQTINGTSGSGIFVYEDGELKLTAVHSGFRGHFEVIKGANPELFQALREGSIVNYGTLVNLPQ